MSAEAAEPFPLHRRSLSRRVGAARKSGNGASSRPRQPVVAVPVRDEVQRIGGLIDALGRQTFLGDGSDVLPVVLVFNNCTDDSAAVAIAAAAAHPRLVLHPVVVDFPPACAHVGSARRLALDVARSLVGHPGDAALLTTDADARPFPGWVEANLSAIAAGADAVGGRIVGNAEEEALLGPRFAERARLHLLYAALCDELCARIDPLAHDPWPRHQDHTGGSLAVRAEFYDRVGGLPAVPSREDLAFVSRLRAAGARLRHDPAASVEVSARTVGRAFGGMADCLRNWAELAEAEAPHLVEAPASVVARARFRADLRTASLADFGVNGPFAGRLDISSREWRLRHGDGSLRGYLVEQLAPDLPDAPASVPVAEAIAELALHLAAAEEIVRAA